MRKKKFQDFHLEDTPLNLTPLIDVVFVVLVTFILIAPMLEIDIVDLSSSEGEKPTFQENSNLQIIVKDDNSIFLNHQKVEINHLEQILISQKQKYPSQTLQLFHDQKAAFGTYQTIKNVAEKSGFDEIHVILKPN